MTSSCKLPSLWAPLSLIFKPLLPQTGEPGSVATFPLFLLPYLSLPPSPLSLPPLPLSPSLPSPPPSLPSPPPSTGATTAFFGGGSGPIFLDDVKCQGGEADLLQCEIGSFQAHNCDHREDAGVICKCKCIYTLRLVPHVYLVAAIYGFLHGSRSSSLQMAAYIDLLPLATADLTG